MVSSWLRDKSIVYDAVPRSRPVEDANCESRHSESWLPQVKSSTHTLLHSLLTSFSVDMKVAHLAALEVDIQNGSTTYLIPDGLDYDKLISRQTFSSFPDGNSVLQTNSKNPIESGSSVPSTPPPAGSQIISSIDLQSFENLDSQNSVVPDSSPVIDNVDLREKSPQDPDSSSIQERLRQMVR